MSFVDVLNFIEALAKIGQTPICRVSQYNHKSFDEHELAELPGVKVGGESWLEIKRLRTKPPPPLPDHLELFVKLTDTPDKEPQLNQDAITAHSDAYGENYAVVFGRIESDLASYLNGWRSWAEIERPRRKTIKHYESLFSIHRAIEEDSATNPIELVWGFNVCLLKSENETIDHPIILQSVEITIDEQSLALRVTPRDVPPYAELSCLAGLQNQAVPTVKSDIENFLIGTSLELSPENSASHTGNLDLWTQHLGGSQACFWRKDEHGGSRTAPPTPQEALCITDTWVLFARSKDKHFLLRDLDRLKDNVQQTPPTAEGPLAFILPAPNITPVFNRIPFRGISSPVAGGDTPRELYFPKPYNEEQVKIVERLEQAAGVVVQGPPGTGKTHTIANIICHYLACGKRVLVTAKGEPALRVLKDKLPNSVKDLAVSLLSNDQKGLEEMNQSVNMLLKNADLDRHILEVEINQLRLQLDRDYARIAHIENDIKEWAHKQLQPIIISGREIFPEELSRLLVGQEELHNWLPGPVRYVELPTQFDDQDIIRLRQARQRVGEHLDKLTWTFPNPDTVLAAHKITNLHQRLCLLNTFEVTQQQQNLPRPHANYSTDNLQQADHLVSALKCKKQILEYQHSTEDQWLWKIWQDLSNVNPSASLKQATADLKQLLDDFKRIYSQHFFVELPNRSIENKQFRSMVDRLAQGHQIGFFSNLFEKNLVNQLESVRHNGLSIPLRGSAQRWQQVKKFISFEHFVRVRISKWNAFIAQQYDGPKATGLDACLVAKVDAILELFNFIQTGNVYINETLSRIFHGPDGNLNHLDQHGGCERYIASLNIYLQQARLHVAQTELDDLTIQLARHSNPLVQSMLNILHHIGRPEFDHLQMISQWDELRSQNEQLNTLAPDFEMIRNVANLISASGGNAWAHAIRTQPASPQLDPLLPDCWDKAWKWHRLIDYLRSIDGQAQLFQLANDLSTTEKKLQIKQESLVEKLIQQKLTFMTIPQRQALQQYAIAVRNIGAGTGTVRTPHFRQQAQDAMKRAVAAVPCWIMPHWRISEALPAEVGLFHLVIIDEASQSDITAFPALMRGEKLLVVGDDKQVSPTSFLQLAQVNTLANQYLSNVPLRNQMIPPSSIYDLACVAFVADGLCLKEHFRCVEPIIQYSNRFYGNKLIPLRIPTATERLDPPLIDIFVRDGHRDGRKKTNLPEAMAIVNEIKMLVADSRFAKKTIGVISMVGQQQSKLIFELLYRDKDVGEEKIIRHQIVCGEPPNFQGNEKEIIFLSMVDDANQLRATAGLAAQQRYNVAASRARDRMYLFRSFQRGDIRNPNCLRAGLLDHFSHPMQQDERQVAQLRDLCESDFEEQVFDELVTRHYRVTPQVRSGGNFRIDLVVEGENNQRLAIECDGDRFHGPGEYFRDLQRQRVLERTGWTFWRCWGSNFYRDREAALISLWAKLEEMNIQPTGTAGLPSRYTEYREVLGMSGSYSPTDDDQSEEDSTEVSDIDTDLEEGFELVPEITEQEEKTTGASVIQSDLTASTHPSPATERLAVIIGDTVVYCILPNEKEIKTLQIVMNHENASMGIVKANSPIARAMLGAEIGEVIEARLPTGVKELKILGIDRCL